jgi:DNA modification methylase
MTFEEIIQTINKKPYYQDDAVVIYYADNRDILPLIPDKSVDLVLTDPPYGAKNNCDYTRFSGGLNPSRNFNERNRQSGKFLGIIDDDKEFNPEPLLVFENVIIWGYQYFAQRVPLGTILVWNKKRDNQLGAFLSDCELAWQKGGNGVYLFNHLWHGMDRQSERQEKSLHPTQKPVELIAWCLKRKPEAQIILDPFLGSGTTAFCAKKLGRKCIGIEIEEKYCEIAAKRCAQSVMKLEAPIEEPKQMVMK